MKKFLSILLALSLPLGLITSATALPAETGAHLLQVYGNNMLFAADKPIVLAGFSTPGKTIKAELLLDGNILQTGQALSGADGLFTLELTGMPGGYDEYEMRLYENALEFKRLTGIVFGALWLASGQSNMQYGLSATYEGYALSKTGATDAFIRALQIPSYPKYQGSPDLLPYEALEDIEGAFWCKGDDTSNILGISAVAYFFAEVLRAELDMPVGILNSSLGGSSIYSWLSREAIDSEPAVKDYLISRKRYITEENWYDREYNPYVDMTANYNKKIHPLRHFRPQGMIWYQGESDISKPKEYAQAFELLQNTYSQVFGHTSGKLPFIFTHLAAYNYGNTLEAYNYTNAFNIMLTEFQAQAPACRAATTIYDVSLEYDTKKIAPEMPAVGAIHPMVKKPVGLKMAFAAMGLVYGKRSDYTAAYPEKTWCEGKYLYIKFKWVGDGLLAKEINGPGTPLYGFALADILGRYVEAKAEIVAPDTVRVWNCGIEKPLSATYAYSRMNMHSNLFASENGEVTLGVSPFITKELVFAKYTQDKYWSTCDFDAIWREIDEPDYFPAFKAKGSAALSIDNEQKYSGTGSLKVDYKKSSTAGRFSFGPNLLYKPLSSEPFPTLNSDYSLYSSISFKVLNDTGRDINFEGLRMYTSKITWFAPLLCGSDSPSTTIPADGQWHTISLDLNRLRTFGINSGMMVSAHLLSKVIDLDLHFADKDGQIGDSGSIHVDDFCFTPNSNPLNFNAAHNGLLLMSFLTRLVAFINSLWF